MSSFPSALKRCARSGTRVILSGLREQPRSILLQMGIEPDGAQLEFARDFADAVKKASSTLSPRSPPAAPAVD